MSWYYPIGVVVILLQLLFVVLAYRNHRYALNKYKRDRSWYQPRTVLIVPCRGLDVNFEQNITSFFMQDYNNYLLWFVVESENDSAYPALVKLKEQLAPASKALEVKILIAGPADICSQKIHNLLYCYRRIPSDVEVLAFADSDITVRPDWLNHLVYPLHKEKNGLASGYRWFVPLENNLPTLALSAGNAKIAQLLGNSIFNQAWGGSMAIRLETFRKLQIDELWNKALSDDLSLSQAVKKAGLKIAFVPASLVASYESATWTKVFEFARRQFLITKVYSPSTWYFAVAASTGSVLTTWGTIAAAGYAAHIGLENLWFFITVPAIVLICQLLRAVIRQATVAKLLEKDLPKLKAAMAADILLFWLWSLILWGLILSTVAGRTIRWRGIRYKMLSPTQTIVIRDW